MLLTKTLLHTTDTYIRKLEKGGIVTVADLIGHYPRTYKDKSQVLEYFSFVNIREPNTIRVTIETITEERTRNNKQLIKAVLRDKGGFLSEAVWFNRRFLLQKFRADDIVILYGKPKYEYGKLSFTSADIEHFKEDGSSIEPVYSDCNYINGSWFEGKMSLVREYFGTIPEIIPEEIRKKKNFRTKRENLLAIHFPANKPDFERARSELAYEELFHLQYSGLLRKKEGEKLSEGRSIAIPLDADLVKEIIARLLYQLTGGQKIVLFQILKDMERTHAMQRLLQGDVGTGKTIVVLIAAIHAILESQKKGQGIQVAILAPTEILARQHFASSMELLSGFGITSDLLVGGLSPKQKKDIKSRLRNGNISVIIGTHALLEDDVHFLALGLTIVDEQHRFGVEQRRALEQYSSRKIPPTPLTKGGDKQYESEDSAYWTDEDLKNRGLVSTGFHIPYNPKLIERSKELRKNMTESEKKLWYQCLSGQEKRFLRQRPIDNYIADFYCPDAKLVIELDGGGHFTEDGKDYDKERTSVFEGYGLTVLRFTNDEVIGNIAKVNKTITEVLDKKILSTSLIKGGGERSESGGSLLPHVLNMTATPIPRTLSLTIYGDQDISVLSEYPAGRLPIHTKVIREEHRNEAYNFIAEEVRAGRQVYWISPLVEESESLDIASAVNMQEILASVFPDYRIGLIHGKMRAKEKDQIMQDFYEHKIDILSSTSVVEVGVDNPNASVICIEASERFGLSQLHQFRGRVGRGEAQSYCYLFTTKSYTGERLRAMEQTNDGFELSEIDLELRGPGEVYGVRQSGVPEFKIADIKDLELVSEIREDIEEFMKK